MQNEFEKQVSRKMEELDLVPSAPVWENIEWQIRKKKDRRRLFVWLLFALIFIGGTTWFVVDQFRPHENLSSANVPTQTTEGKSTANSNKDFSTPGDVPVSASSNRMNNDARNGLNTEAEIELPGTPGRQPVSQGPNQTLTVTGPAKPNSRIIEEETGPGTTESITGTKETVKKNDAVPSTGIAVDVEEEKQDTATVDSVVKDVVVSEPLTENPFSEVKTISGRSWVFGVTAGAGVSGEGRGIRLAKSMFDLANSPTPSLSFPTEGSATNMDLHFTFAVHAKRQLNKKFAFISGLEYQYFSSKRMAGIHMEQDSVLPGGISLTEFYYNFGQQPTNVSSSYHFISVPLLLEWKVNKKIPIVVQAGISYKHLVASNALQFNRQYSIYFTDHASLNHSQLFANFNLSYQFSLRNKSFVVGPSLQHGLTKISNGEEKKLYSLGLNATMFFNK